MKNIKKLILLTLSLTIIAGTTLYNNDLNPHTPIPIHDDTKSTFASQ